MEFLAENKKAFFNYEILEKFNAGIELLGLEVKSLKSKRGTLDGAYVSVRDNEVFLLGAVIPPYQAKNTPADYEPTRPRRLLLTKKEIGQLISWGNQRGLTIVPLSLYNSGRKIKVTVAVARGKKKYDKRETLKKREANREIQRTLKNQ
ncbi:MAG: SsrA-binding protein [Parcubacteria group bacterium GW2011_GWB1_44_7]|nr:MAG: SsrA-binding protein [Parcubacteria group bacterium GW2011_GWB1_44_7]